MVATDDIESKAINDAILQNNKNEYHPVDAVYASYALLDSVASADGKQITYYLSAMCEEFNLTNGEIDWQNPVGGSHMPLAITFEIDQYWSYNLIEYWRPRDGSYYQSDIENKFPKTSLADAMDIPKYSKQLKQDIQNQIAQAGN